MSISLDSPKAPANLGQLGSYFRYLRKMMKDPNISLFLWHKDW